MRSTLLRGLVTVALLTLWPYRAVAASAIVSPSQAIESAVEQRFGAGVRVEVVDLDTTVTGEPALQAVPDPAARTGLRVRYQLMANGVRIGTAVASVKVMTQYARAAHPIDRGAAITPAALEMFEGLLPDTAFRHLPTVDELVGLRAKRAIAVGEALTAALVEVPPVVQTGDKVTVTLTLGQVQAVGEGRASGSGHIGEIIRVTAPDSRKLLRARITGRGSVEIIQ